ncbi:lipopolysaccharide assembly protein LapA domain-containing protein [Sporosarcina oncorhynchi]|uniref:Lipopolysaccharide assembly protein LapA domain-containing protein n=1 Tax=Sporosarcina oncorhynchi TaxID=3056444 RepID=A0ABZ0LAY1_9BACL|nr:lipopolysaccharide assembly protein LapA domain-containing protein [Sporosarcina sp. T2O-4]WOV88759.1 lipopolysaccharide assembly protein LapA domain-containing protein [Sporosarcina sp. T2O-4]
MKQQWAIILSIIFAILIAVFAVLNVEAVKVNYLFGTAQLPLILVILFTALLGAAISGFMAMFKTVKMNRRISDLQKENTAKELMIADQQNEIVAMRDSEKPQLIKDNIE